MSETPPPEESPRARLPPRLHPIGTVLFASMVAYFGLVPALFALVASPWDRPDFVPAAIRVAERNLEAGAARAGKPADRGDPRFAAELDRAADCFARLVEFVPRDRRADLLARRAVLESERGNPTAAGWAVGALDESPAEEAFESAYRVAYEDGPADEYGASEDPELPSSGWTRARLRMRLDTALGEERAADGIGAEILERGEELLRRQRRVELVGLLAIPLGLVLWFVWWRRGAPRQRIGAGLSEPPWSGSEGLAVIVRSIVFGVGLMAVVAAFDSGGAGMEVFSLSTPWLALPLLVGIRIYLLGPHGLRFAPTFGLTVLEGEERGRRLVRLLGLVCALFALEHAGEVAIGTATDWLGLESRWSDELVPGLLLGSTARAATIAVDQILLAPVLYEIAFRGLLYQTLRTYLTPHLAALASAALFGLWFQQSLPGFLAILWSGYVWALAFEHTRSLVPGMLCHGLVNALALAHLATYR